ncbi:unnamed protein product [Staurois parvus]|uniref:Uncharacterized protein n=1 Tax=Staurois parvus TaxID=386267 RepID=A0ABN9CFF9_9NEOB|nr:unnamed protein product [Staurois parvus]
MRGPGRADIVNAGRPDIVNVGPGRADIVNAGSGESGYSECGVPGRADIVNAGSGESGYSECGVRRERI